MRRLLAAFALIAGTAGVSAPPENGLAMTIAQGGGSLAVPTTGGVRLNLVFPSSDARNGIGVMVASASPHAGEATRVAFTVDRDVKFAQYPTVYVASAALAADAAAFVTVDDATAGQHLVTLDKLAYGPGTFPGGPWHERGEPFLAIADHRYEVAVVTTSDSQTAWFPTVSQSFTVPRVAGIEGTVTLPPASRGGGPVLVRTSLQPPVGVPPFAGTVIAYATVVPIGIASYDGTASIALRLPVDSPPGSYALAGFDDGAWFAGWHEFARAAATDDRRLTFGIDLPDRRFEHHRYALALYRVAAEPFASPSPASGAPPTPLLAVVGDSLTTLTIVPPSLPGCIFGFGPEPDCQYVFDPELEFASVAGRRAGFRVDNLSYVGTTAIATDDRYESQIADEIPQIDPATDVVVVASGTSDTLLGAHTDVSNRLDALTTAIRGRASGAHLVYVGVRYYLAVASDARARVAIDAWNAKARALGARYGGYVDAESVLGPGASARSPDGGHLSVAGAAALADRLAPLLATFARSRMRPAR